LCVFIYFIFIFFIFIFFIFDLLGLYFIVFILFPLYFILSLFYCVPPPCAGRPRAGLSAPVFPRRRFRRAVVSRLIFSRLISGRLISGLEGRFSTVTFQHSTFLLKTPCGEVFFSAAGLLRAGFIFC